MEFNHPTCYSLLLRFFYCETSACLLWKTTQVFPLCKLNDKPDDDWLPLPEQLTLLISEFYWAGCLSHFLLRNILTGQTGLLMAELCTSATVPGTWHSNMCWLKVSFTSNRIIIHFMNRSSVFPSKYLWQKFHQNKQYEYMLVDNDLSWSLAAVITVKFYSVMFLHYLLSHYYCISCNKTFTWHFSNTVCSFFFRVRRNIQDKQHSRNKKKLHLSWSICLPVFFVGSLIDCTSV